jgi:hypothetical protein
MSDEYEYDDLDSSLGLDDEDRKAAKSDNDVDWYKGTKNRTDRVAILLFQSVDEAAILKARNRASKAKTAQPTREEQIAIAKKALSDRAAALNKSVDQLTEVDKLDLNAPNFKKFTHHFVGKGVGDIISRMGKDGPEADKLWSKIEEAKTHFVTLLLIYPSNKEGELDKDVFKSSWIKDPIIKPWRFSQKRYDLIWKVNSGLRKNGLSIANQDLLLECKDDQYQQIEPSADGKAVWLQSENLKKQILERAIKFYKKINPYRVITTAQLREKLGLEDGSDGVSTDSSDTVDTEEFKEFIDTV